MKKKHLTLVLQAALLVSSIGYAEAQPQQIAQAKEYIASKRTVQLSERFSEGELTLGGEVALEYHHYNEKRPDLISQGGRTAGPSTDNADNAFTVAGKMMLDYKTDNTWASIKFKMKNGMGQGNDKAAVKPNRDSAPGAPAETLVTQDKRNGSGSSNRLSLDKAFFGFNLYEHDSTRVDLEIGRVQRDDYFTSKVQFDSYQDGIVLSATHGLTKGGNLYVNLSPGVVDQLTRHYNFTGEVGVNHLFETGFNLKYSYAGWKKAGKDYYSANNTSSLPVRADTVPVAPLVALSAETNPIRHRYQTSQITASYDFPETFIKVPVSIYGAYLLNHAAKAETAPGSTLKKNNHGWYAGFNFGAPKIKKKGDWQVDVNYRYVEGQVVAEYDMASIGPTQNTNIGMRAANFKGFAVKGEYAMQDCMRVCAEFQQYRQAKKKFDNQGRLNGNELVLSAKYLF